jgi:2-haloacid dehalogenase
MQSTSLPGVRACVFDAYGTLFDLNSAIAACAADLGAKAEALNRLWREKQLQYTWLRAVQQRHADFWQVTAEALDYALAVLGIAQPGLREKLLESYLVLETFAEVPEVLHALNSAGLRLAILSNGTPAMLRQAVEHAQLDGIFDAVLSVETVGVYKPHPRVYALATETLHLPASQIAFASSNPWDAYAATAFGMRVIWCNRYNQPPENLPGRPDCCVSSLAGIPALLRN